MLFSCIFTCLRYKTRIFQIFFSCETSACWFFSPFTQKQWAFPICRLFNSKTIAVTLFGSREIKKPHTHDLPKGEYQHRSSESRQGLAGRIQNVFTSATSACNAVLHSLSAGHKPYLCSPPAQTLLSASCSWPLRACPFHAGSCSSL